MTTTFRRARTEQRTRLVPHTINGITEMVTETYTVETPRAPRDLDQAVRIGVTAATALTVAGSIAWSTASIGDLLARTVPAAVGYGAAAVFDLGWISCMALEWLARYDRRRAELPRRLGYVALLIAMAAVATHGILAGGHGAVVIGIIGALVSALAKGMWAMVMKTFGAELDDRSQQWVQARFSEAQARLATAAVTRELARVEGAVADYRAVYGGDSPTEIEPAQPVPAEAARNDATVRSAIAAARTVLGPTATPAIVAAQLVLARVFTDPETAVRVVAEHMVREGAHHGAPQVTGMSKAAAITEIAEWCGEGAPADLIVQILAHQDHKVTDSQVRNELSRARKKAAATAPAKTAFGFGKP